MAAGGFADVWKAMYNGRTVVLKSYRRYMDFDVARVAVVCRTVPTPQIHR